MFAALFNIGIAHRLIRDYDQATSHFKQALELAQTQHELDSECFANGQLGFTYFLKQDYRVALAHFQMCHDSARTLKIHRLQLDCQLCMGFLTYDSGDFKSARSHFQSAHKLCRYLKQPELAEECLCNVGIAMGNQRMQELQEQMAGEDEGSESEAEGGMDAAALIDSIKAGEELGKLNEEK